MHKIGIISDTHNLLRAEIKELLKDCDAILHGGDIMKQEILDELGRISSIYAVRGNNDREWAVHLREALMFELYGLHFFFLLDKKKISPAKLKDIDIVVYGHSHKFEAEFKGEKLWLNPGSCGPKRFMNPVSMAILEVENGQCRLVKIEIEDNVKFSKILEWEKSELA